MALWEVRNMASRTACGVKNDQPESMYQHISRCHFNLWRFTSDSGTFNNLTDNKVKELEENKEKVYKTTYDFELWYKLMVQSILRVSSCPFKNWECTRFHEPMWSKRDTRMSITSHIIIVYKKSGCDRYRETSIERLSEVFNVENVLDLNYNANHHMAYELWWRTE